MAFDLFDIVKKLGATPQELRAIADKLEKDQGIVMSEQQRIYESYKKKFIAMLKLKRNRE